MTLLPKVKLGLVISEAGVGGRQDHAVALIERPQLRLELFVAAETLDSFHEDGVHLQAAATNVGQHFLQAKALARIATGDVIIPVVRNRHPGIAQSPQGLVNSAELLRGAARALLVRGHSAIANEPHFRLGIKTVLAHGIEAPWGVHHQTSSNERRRGR